MKLVKQTLALTSILIICLSSKIDKGFEALEIYDYFKAKKLFTKSLKKNKVAASYGLSIIYGRKDNPFYNLDSAFKYISIADTSYSKLEEKAINKLKKQSLDSILIKTWKDSIDYKVFEKAKRFNNIEVYNKYLARHNNSKINPIVTYKRDSIAFSETKAINNSDAYSEFILSYPNSVFVNESRNRYEERLFYQVAELNSAKEYNSFIKNNPNSPYNNQAQDSLFKLQTKNKDIESYSAFIEKYPANKNVNKAWRLIYKLFTADFKPEKIVDFRLEYPEYPFLNELKTDFELAQKEFFPIKRENKWGFIDENGNQMIKAQYDFVEPFSDGVALVVQQGRIGYINKAGDIVIPIEYSEGESFQNGLAIAAKQDQYGIINKTNFTVLPFQYEEIGHLDAELILVANETAYGYVDHKGEIKVPLKYKTAYDFNNGLAIVKDTNLFGAINILGLEVIKCQYEWLEPFDEYGRSRAKLDGKYGIIDVNGGIVIPFDYDAIGSFNDSIAVISKEGKYGYVNILGEIVIPMEYDYLPGVLLWGNFDNGYAKFHQKKKYGILNKKGEKTFPAIFEDVGVYSDTNLIAVKKRGKWGYSNQNLRLMIPYQYQKAKTFSMSRGFVQEGEYWFLINEEGEKLNELPYLAIEKIDGDYIKVQSLTGWGIIDKTNSIILEPIYSRISHFSNSVFKINKDEEQMYFSLDRLEFVK